MTLKEKSLNSSAGESKDFADLLDRIPATETQPELEIQAPIEKLRSLVVELLAGLDEETDRLLLLRYGLELSGRAIAPFFQIDQSNISRRYNRVSQTLLKQVAAWARSNLGVNPDSEAIAEMKAPLGELLKQYYQKIFRSQLRQGLAQLNDRERQLLHWHYIQKQDKAAIANRLQLPEAEIGQKLATSRQVLERAIGLWLQNRFSVSPDALLPLREKLVAWLRRVFHFRRASVLFIFDVIKVILNRAQQ